MREAGLALLLVTSALVGCIGTGSDVEPEQAEPASADLPGEFSETDVFAGEYDTNESYGVTLEEGPYDVLETEALYLDSETDGANIEIGVVRPDVPNGTEVPVVAFASPYLYPLHAQDLTETRPRLTENFVDHGYAVAFVAVRGTADSGGCSDLMGPKERADLDQAITWLGEQDWSNGNVGMLGVSYDGSTPWEVAAQGNPHLKTIVPISGVNDVYDLMYYNGTPEQRGAVLLNALYYGWFAFSLPDRAPQRTADAVMCPQAYEGFTASIHSSVTGERDPLDYWAERNSRPGVEENYNGSIFMVQGMQDWNVDPAHNVPWAQDLDEQGLEVKYLLGQWFHAWPDGDYLDQPTRRVDFVEILLHWFDHELKGNTTRDIGPKVQVQDNSGQWRSEQAWPPERATETTYHLAPSGELTTDPDTSTGTVTVGAAPASTLVGEPGIDCVTAACPGPEKTVFEATDPAECGGCAVFTSETFEERTHLAGYPPLHVDVTPTGPTGHLSAFLYAVNDTDRERLTWTQMDLRFADGDETAEPIVPGEKITARMQFQPFDGVVPAGAHLELVLEQGKQGDHQPMAPPAPVQLHVGGNASTLVVDTFQVTDEQTFESPGE